MIYLMEYESDQKCIKSIRAAESQSKADNHGMDNDTNFENDGINVLIEWCVHMLVNSDFKIGFFGSGLAAAARAVGTFEMCKSCQLDKLDEEYSNKSKYTDKAFIIVPAA